MCTPCQQAGTSGASGPSARPAANPVNSGETCMCGIVFEAPAPSNPRFRNPDPLPSAAQAWNSCPSLFRRFPPLHLCGIWPRSTARFSQRSTHGTYESLQIHRFNTSTDVEHSIPCTSDVRSVFGLWGSNCPRKPSDLTQPWKRGVVKKCINLCVHQLPTASA